jgi:hypothetical protein
MIYISWAGYKGCLSYTIYNVHIIFPHKSPHLPRLITQSNCRHIYMYVLNIDIAIYVCNMSRYVIRMLRNVIIIRQNHPNMSNYMGKSG